MYIQSHRSFTTTWQGHQFTSRYKCRGALQKNDNFFFNGQEGGGVIFRVASSLLAYQYLTIAVTVKGLICSG